MTQRDSPRMTTMDATSFDSLTRSLTELGSRLQALTAALAGSLGLLGLSENAAGKRKRKIRKKKNIGGQTPTSPPSPRPPPLSPPPPPPATCNDEIKNGSESDVDCGGSCPRCGNGKAC